MKISTLILAVCTLCFAACAGTPKKSTACCSQKPDKCCAHGKTKTCSDSAQCAAPKKSS